MWPMPQEEQRNFAHTLLQLCWDWHFDRTAGQLFMVEQTPRMGQRAFRPSNSDFFTGLPGDNENGEYLYRERNGLLNSVLRMALPKGVKGHPDIHMLRYLKPRDGKHLNFDGNQKIHEESEE